MKYARINNNAPSRVGPAVVVNRDDAKEWVVETNRYTEDHHWRNPNHGWVPCHDAPWTLAKAKETLSRVLERLNRIDQGFQRDFGIPPDETQHRIRNIVTGEIILGKLLELVPWRSI